MAIDAFNDRVYKSGIKESVATAKSKPTKALTTSGGEVAAKSTDAVILTESAKTMSKAVQKAKDSSGIDEAKVEKLKSAIKDGSYKINYESVANKLIDSEDELSSIFG